MSLKNKSNAYKHIKYNTRNLIDTSEEEENNDNDNDKDDNFKFFINKINNNFFVSNKSNFDYSNNECIGPCFPKNNYIYNPISLVIDKTNDSMCPVKPFTNSNNERINFKECNYRGDKSYLNFDVLDHNNPFLLIARNDNLFLKEIYNINDINQAYDFINNEFNNLNIYTQKRIINAIFNSYIRDELFPNNTFINYTKKILSSLYKTNVSFDKIYKNIVKIKNKDIIQIDDIFSYFFNKYYE